MIPPNPRLVNSLGSSKKASENGAGQTHDYWKRVGVQKGRTEGLDRERAKKIAEDMKQLAQLEYKNFQWKQEVLKLRMEAGSAGGPQDARRQEDVHISTKNVGSAHTKLYQHLTNLRMA